MAVADELTSAVVTAKMVLNGDNFPHVLGPALHLLGGQRVEWHTLAQWTSEGWHPVAFAYRATQRTQSKTGAELVGDGRCAMEATPPDGHAVQWTPFDVCPLKPRRMKTHGQTRLAIPQLGSAEGERVGGHDGAEAVAHVVDGYLKDVGQRVLIPAIYVTQVAGTASIGGAGIAKRQQIG